MKMMLRGKTVKLNLKQKSVKQFKIQKKIFFIREAAKNISCKNQQPEYCIRKKPDEKWGVGKQNLELRIYDDYKLI